VLLPDEADHEHEWKEQLIAAVLCGVLGLLGYFFKSNSLSVMFYLAAYVAGAWLPCMKSGNDCKKRGGRSFSDARSGGRKREHWRLGRRHNSLVSVLAVGALEHYAMGRTHREIRSLFKTAPKVATVIDERGNECSTPVEQLQPGQRMLIKPGEQFPVDAEIVKGLTAADESNLTGEAPPRIKLLAIPSWPVHSIFGVWSRPS